MQEAHVYTRRPACPMTHSITSLSLSVYMLTSTQTGMPVMRRCALLTCAANHSLNGIGASSQVGPQMGGGTWEAKNYAFRQRRDSRVPSGCPTRKLRRIHKDSMHAMYAACARAYMYIQCTLKLEIFNCNFCAANVHSACPFMHCPYEGALRRRL